MFFSKNKPGAAASGPVQWIVTGLGNPGAKYDCTRHNAGFMALDILAQQLDVRVDKLKFKSLCGDAMIGEQRVLLMKPSTFMNCSGEAVGEAAKFYKVPAERILVMLDDVALDVGRLRLRRGGSDGGHNGLKSIIYHLGADNFPRVRMGVGKKPHPDYDLADWVLGKFRREDTELLDAMFQNAAKAAKMAVCGEMDKAMNLFNR